MAVQSDYNYVGMIENETTYATVCKKDDLYYFGSVSNAGFMVESEGFESLEELYENWVASLDEAVNENIEAK